MISMFPLPLIWIRLPRCASRSLYHPLSLADEKLARRQRINIRFGKSVENILFSFTTAISIYKRKVCIPKNSR
jgi:hypothetical protein